MRNFIKSLLFIIKNLYQNPRDLLSKEKEEAKTIEESEKILNEKLSQLKGMIGLLEKKVSEEDIAIKNSESHVERLNSLIEEIEKRVEVEKSAINPLIEKGKEIEKQVSELQSQIMKKLAQKEKGASNIKNLTILSIYHII